MSETPRTFAVVLTPPGRGAVATVLIEGPRAIEFVAQEFRPVNKRPIESLALNRIAYGQWGNEPGEDVVVAKRATDKIEIHCHGGNAASAAIVRSLAARGATVQSWQPALSREESDPIRRAARIALAQATTERGAEILLEQYRGTLRREIEAVLSLLVENNFAAAEDLLGKLLRYAPLGRHLVEPWRVVLAGPPNVGKSSLINGLVGYNRAIVFDQPGTTRDVVTVRTAFDGWPIELSDTAGIRLSDDTLESAGIERARRQLASADGVVLVFEATSPWTSEDDSLRGEHSDAILALNKCDLLESREAILKSRGGFRDALFTSAVTGEGLAELQRRIMERLIPEIPPPGAAIPFTVEQIDGLQSARDALGGKDKSAAQRESIAALNRILDSTDSD